jgi:hypothetical protein
VPQMPSQDLATATNRGRHRIPCKGAHRNAHPPRTEHSIIAQCAQFISSGLSKVARKPPRTRLPLNFTSRGPPSVKKADIITGELRVDTSPSAVRANATELLRRGWSDQPPRSLFRPARSCTFRHANSTDALPSIWPMSVLIGPYRPAWRRGRSRGKLHLIRRPNDQVGGDHEGPFAAARGGSGCRRSAYVSICDPGGRISQERVKSCLPG